MKRFLLFAVPLFSLMLPSCSNDLEPIDTKQEVSVNLDYSLMQSGSMSRAGDDVYTNFYESCIKTKELAPKNFTLNFSEEGGTEICDIEGQWGDNEGIRIIEGSYKVTGVTHPRYQSTAPKYAGDSLWLKFDETVRIAKDTKTITLSAKYDCFLLLFDASNIKDINTYYLYNDHLKFALNRHNNIYYLFVNKTMVTNSNRESYLIMEITRPSGTKITINLGRLKFEFGKYYYFNDVTNSFDIEAMEPGA